MKINVATTLDCRSVAFDVRRLMGTPCGRLDLAACCRYLRAEVVVAELGAERGGLEGLLTPLPDDRFRITVDPTPRGGWANDRGHLLRRRVRFRVAHEIGHMAFYARQRGDRPRRLRPPGAESEEQFCDAFAGHLLAPIEGQPTLTADLLMEQQETFDVSLEVAARSASSRHPSVAVSLWRWNAGEPGARTRVQSQWESAPGRSESLIAAQDAKSPTDLRRQLAAAAKAGRLSYAIRDESSQAVAVIA